MSEPQSRLTFGFEAGALVRGSALHAVRSAADQLGLKFTELSNDGGWLSTAYRLRVEGDAERVRRFRSWFERASAEWADDP